jgi:hypothetical protein
LIIGSRVISVTKTDERKPVISFIKYYSIVECSIKYSQQTPDGYKCGDDN